MINLLFLIFAHLFFQTDRSTDQLTYSIFQNEKKIGQMIAYKIQDENSTIYRTSSISNARAIININVKSDYEILLENGVLKSAEANVLVRNRPYTHSYTYYCDGQCEMAKDGADIIYISDDIFYASTMLLFEEPVHVNKSYSELDGSFHKINKLGIQQYEKIDQDGRTNLYNYSEGILYSAQIDAGLISFKIKLSSN